MVSESEILSDLQASPECLARNGVASHATLALSVICAWKDPRLLFSGKLQRKSLVRQGELPESNGFEISCALVS